MASPAGTHAGEMERRETTVPALVVLGVAVSLLFVATMLYAAQGHFVAQVPDLYLVCRYAQAMAEGHAFQYNPGEAPSTGATSLLHTALLALAHALGARGEGLVAFAVLAGAAAYLASIVFAVRIARQLASDREASLAGALVALGGPMVWAFHYGSDIALFMLLTLALLDGMLRAWPARRFAPVLAPAVLLALARPEGLVIGLGLAVAWALHVGRGAPRRTLLSAWIPLAASLAVLGLYRSRTGSWLGTSVADKSLVDNYGAVGALALSSEYVVEVVRGLLLGFYPGTVPVGLARGWSSFFFPPLALVGILLLAARPPAGTRAPLRAFLAIVAVASALVVPNVFLGIHFHRYLMWSFPALLVLAGCGLATATRLAAREDVALERGLFRGAAAVAITLGALSTLRFAAVYGDMAGDMWRRDLSAAQWIAGNLPPGATIANVATSVEYLTGHRAMNLHGVTSPDFFGNRPAEREAGVLESLARLPAGERPAWLLSTVQTQASLVSLQAIADGPPLFQSLSLGDDIVVHRTRWDAVDAAREPRHDDVRTALAGLRLTDSLNVCDRRDEDAHAYRVVSQLGDVRLNGLPRLAPEPGGPLLDAGRAVLGSESFDVAVTPGRDAVLVMRTSSAAAASVLRADGARRLDIAFSQAGFVLTVDGQPAGRHEFAPREGWEERVVRIPAALLRGAPVRLALSGRYASFRYWIYQ